MKPEKKSWMRNALIASVVSLLAFGGGTGVASESGGGGGSFEDGAVTLGVGDAVFWEGDVITSPTGTGLPGLGGNFATGPYNEADIEFPLCGTTEFPCQDYPITLTDPGYRLRVASDMPRGATVGLEIFGPDGTLLAAERHEMSVEVFVDSPEAGDYLLRMVPYSVAPPDQERIIRFRAMLEDEPKERSSHAPATELLPNMKSRFGVVQIGECEEEITGNNVADVPESRCLRFTTVSENAGDGPMDIALTPSPETNLERSPSTQRVHYSDGSIEERPAGFHDPLPHASHAHYHLSSFLLFELERVVDESKGEVEPVTAGQKVGWCPVPSRMVAWERFFQDPLDDDFITDREGTNCGLDQTDPVAALGTGWADIYFSGTPGQYLNVDPEDGTYVVRTTIDPLDAILETDEGDNSCYALIEVVDGVVVTLERGYGLSPWDPKREVNDPRWA